MQRGRLFNPYVLFSVLTLLSVAALTGGGLALLAQLHREGAHRTAAKDVLDQGRLIAAQLASQPIVASTKARSTDWNEFSQLVRSLAAVEDGLQYVSVSRGDVTLYHEQVGDERDDPPLPPGMQRPPRPDDVEMRRSMLQLGQRTLPVVVFSTDFQAPDGEVRHVEVGLHRDLLSRKESVAEQAVTSMFKLSAAAIAISFGACSILLGWAGRREWKRIARRRTEEHLAFSGVLANGIVHDFRNPMSSMRLDIQMLERETAKATGVDMDKVTRLAGRVRTTMDRLDKVFQEFLYIAKPAEDERRPLCLHTCVSESLSMLHARFEQAGVSVESSIPEALHVLVYESSLRRALVNVLINAEQFSPEGGSVTIEAQREGHWVELKVKDRGPGIASSMRDDLFEMFMTSRPGGTGLGLFLAKAAVERSGGTIDVEQTGPAGTTIHLRLPIAPQLETTEARSSSHE